jgi:hypothetical protein
MRISPDDVLANLTTRSIQKKNNVYKMYLALYILTLIVTLTEGFYLPGLAPVVYCGLCLCLCTGKIPPEFGALQLRIKL